jgi:4-alpha-glucanotransferase
MLPDFPNLPKRAGGVLLHPTSLPSPYGIGDLGPSAHAWLDWLSKAGCSLWQILPLGPTGFADSPYQSFSAFAGNHLLISPQLLLEQGLISALELEGAPSFPEDRVDYGAVITWKEKLLEQAAATFERRAKPELLDEYQTYCEDQRAWLDDFALFMALKREHEGKPWTDWPAALRDREVGALKAANEALAVRIQDQKVRQYLFSAQWSNLRRAAQEYTITIIGDIPIFIAHDSADIWARPEFFCLDTQGQPVVVAGVPPDYFSATGQRWGNPHYNWTRMAQDGFTWWIRRFEQVLNRVDVVRLDHFRGFEAFWEIPGTEETAVNGRWVPGPRHALLDRLKEALGGLPIIAEDLGIITEEVVALRLDYGLPGMKVMQFGFEGGPDDDFLPQQFEEGYVAYTGTHDNDTTLGWYQAASSEVQDFCRRYLSSNGDHIVWDIIETLWASVAAWTIVPLQDPLELGSEARMNFPSRTHGNWSWRVVENQLTDELAERLRDMNQRHGRVGGE